MRGGYHDAYATLTSQNLSYSTSGGTAVSTTGFSNMTQYVRLAAPGAASANGGVRYAVGKAPAATSTSTLLPLNWVEVVQVPAGSQISALSNDSTGGTLNVTELS
jgi:hypothetical protein